MEDDYDQSVPDEDLRDPVKTFVYKPKRSVFSILWNCVKGFCYFLGSIVIYLLFVVALFHKFLMFWSKLSGVDASGMAQWNPLDWSARIRYTIGVIIILAAAYILSQLGIDGVKALFA